MRAAIRKKLSRLGWHWEVFAVTGVLLVLVALLVDLHPVVDENFFFATSDPAVRQEKKIEKRFPNQLQLILTVSAHDIASPHYLERIQRLTHALEGIGGVTSVKSLTDGPKNFQDALVSPFWSRLLIAKDRKASNLIVFLETQDTEKLVRQIEKVRNEFDEKNFRVHIAGPPYVVE